MRLSEADAWNRVAGARHGVLGTLHPDRGIDLVPAVYAVGHDRTVFIPIDIVKPKDTTQLQRLANLAADPRCTLLVDEYDEDWSRLWWVRIHGTGIEAPADEVERFLPLLAGRYPQYTEPGSVVGGILMRPIGVTGWAAGVESEP